MIALSDFSYDYGGRYLFKNANWHIKPNERIGLVGLNGTGKSTLLRLITGDFALREGVITRAKDATIGFLNQDLLSFISDESILNVAMMAFERQLELEKKLEAIYAKMETDYSDKVLQEMADLQEEFSALDGYNIKSKTAEVLAGLGFSNEDLLRPLSTFSGGWRMRVILAQMLLRNPKLLLLDEPTNHLDLPSIEWLEEYLQSYEGTVIIVSHDRWFLNRMVTKITEVAHQKLYHYTGNYDQFLESKTERDEMQKRRFDNQQQFIKQQERFIERFKAKASKATAAQSRMKMLDKIERIEVLEEEKVNLNLDFGFTVNPGKVICTMKHVSKSYDNLEVFRNASAEVLRGDKIGFIGANGKGKTTLLNIIDHKIDYDGVVEDGYNVIRSYYAQHQLESLNIENEILEELKQSGSNKTENELRGILGCFLFTGDTVFKKIKVLSGGEKARVALAKTLLQQANFMLLDEPTNHLDLQSIAIITEALQNYKGTFIVVSHDRHFVSQVANKIWYIEDGDLKEYPGTFEEYNWWLKNQNLDKAPVKAVQKEKKVVVEVPKPDNNALKEKKKLQEELANIDSKIEDIKKEIITTEHQLTMSDVLNDSEKLTSLGNKHQELEQHLIQMNKQYEVIFEKLLDDDN